MTPTRAKWGLGLACALAVMTAGPVPADAASPVSPRAASISPAEARAWKPDMAAARRYAKRRQGNVTFAVFDMAGRSHLHRAHEKAYMASTVKVMLMVAYLRRASGRALSGSERALMRKMIRKSDNSAATRIRDSLGRKPLERLARRARMKSFRWSANWGTCRTSARDQAHFLRTLKRYVPRRHWAFAQRQLARIVSRQRWGVADAKPRAWKLYFKGGWAMPLGGVNHQAALLRRGGRRVGVGVLTTQNPSRAYGIQTLEGVFRRLLRGLP